MVNKPLIRPAISGGYVARGGLVDQPQMKFLVIYSGNFQVGFDFWGLEIGVSCSLICLFLRRRKEHVHIYIYLNM